MLQMILINHEIIMKLLIIHYEMTLAKIRKINRSVNERIYFNRILEKKKKKTLLHYFDTKTKQMYTKKICISVARWKMPNIWQNQYNSKQMFRIKIKYN